jgi:hypothetical protein
VFSLGTQFIRHGARSSGRPGWRDGRG